jgi:hypothetical protein
VLNAGASIGEGIAGVFGTRVGTAVATDTHPPQAALSGVRFRTS